MGATIVLIGNVGSLEVRKTKGDGEYIVFSLAVNRYVPNQKDSVTDWYSCIVFNPLAQRMVSSKVDKGSRITVSGEPGINHFTRKDGTKGTSVEVKVFSWSFINSGKKHESNDDSSNNASLAQPRKRTRDSQPSQRQVQAESTPEFVPDSYYDPSDYEMGEYID